jgi:protein-S-isoprenylcysteine O-methyltransferase Ste14
MKQNSNTWFDYIPALLASILFLLQIIIGIVLLPDVLQNQFIAYLGVAMYIFSGLIFGMLPVLEFRKKGGVKKGKSYIATTKLVDTGIYAIVRHPQFLTFIMFAFAGMLLFQHWIIILIGLPIIPLVYLDLIRADKQLILKFDEKYKRYMQKVPRVNFLLGIIRWFMNRK